MSASNTAHVPMDEPHLSRYGPTPPGTGAGGSGPPGDCGPGDAARAGRGGARRQELAAGPRRAGARPGAVEWLLDNAYLAAPGGADGGAGLPQGQAPAALPERPVCPPVCRPDGRFGRSPTWTSAA